MAAHPNLPNEDGLRAWIPRTTRSDALAASAAESRANLTAIAIMPNGRASPHRQLGDVGGLACADLVAEAARHQVAQHGIEAAGGLGAGPARAPAVLGPHLQHRRVSLGVIARRSPESIVEPTAPRSSGSGYLAAEIPAVPHRSCCCPRCEPRGSEQEGVRVLGRETVERCLQPCCDLVIASRNDA